MLPVACVCVCVRAYVRVCVCVCVCSYVYRTIQGSITYIEQNRAELYILNKTGLSYIYFEQNRAELAQQGVSLDAKGQ